MAGFISIPIIILGIYGTYKESFNINILMAMLSSFGVIFSLFSDINLASTILNTAFIALLIYYAYLIKYEESIASQSNNIEMGINGCNESSSIILHSQQFIPEKSRLP
jgi:uncharacterized membrane protein